MPTSLTGLSRRKLLYTKLCDRMNFCSNFIVATGKFCFKTAVLASCSVKLSYALWIDKI